MTTTLLQTKQTTRASEQALVPKYVQKGNVPDKKNCIRIDCFVQADIRAMPGTWE